MDHSMIHSGIFDNKGSVLRSKPNEQIEKEMVFRRKMIPGTMVHYVEQAIRRQVDIFADGHGDYKTRQ